MRTSGSRSRSRSIEKRDRKDSLKDKETTSKPGTPTHDSNLGDADGRNNNNGQNLQNISQGSKKRCRDFDEKGKNKCLYNILLFLHIIYTIYCLYLLSYFASISIAPSLDLKFTYYKKNFIWIHFLSINVESYLVQIFVV